MIASNPEMASMLATPEDAAAGVIEAVLADEPYVITHGDLIDAVDGARPGCGARPRRPAHPSMAEERPQAPLPSTSAVSMSKESWATTPAMARSTPTRDTA